MRIVFDLGAVGEFVFPGFLAVVFEREDGRDGKVIARDRDVSVVGFEILAEDGLGAGKWRKSEEGSDDGSDYECGGIRMAPE